MCKGINMKILCYLIALFVLTSARLTSQDTIRVWQGTINNDFRNTQNWNPPGPPESTHVVIPQRTIFPVLSDPFLFAPLRSVTILNGGRFDITLTGRLSTIDSIHVYTGGMLNISSIDTMRIGGKWIIDSGGVVSISSPIKVTSIGDNVVLNGTLTITGISAAFWCNGNWIRGPGSSFSAGNSTFYFVNPNRQLNVERGTFDTLVLGPVQNYVRIAGNVNVNGTLVVRDSIVVSRGDTLTINNRTTLALNHLTGGLIVRGSVRRLLNPSSIDTIRFHDRNIAIQFRNTSGIPNSVTITSEPDTDLVPCRLNYVRRYYDIGAQGTGFAARLFLRYDSRDLLPPAISSEDSLRLWRSLDGCTWQYVPSRVDTFLNVVVADSVTQFSKWGFGAPNSSPIAQVRTSPQLPLVTQLDQNFPNPFNPSTRIRYTLANYSMVSLKIFNTLGQEIATLVNEHQMPGSYEIDWTAENHPSGIYVYRLSAGKQILDRKMIFLR